MPRRPTVVQKVAEATAVKIAAATETVIATLEGISTDTAGVKILLEASVSLLAPKAATKITMRIRRTGKTGALVGTAYVEDVTAEKNVILSMQAQDTPEGETASGVYVLTVQATAGEGEVQEATVASLSATF